ncbi:hypothetical protein BKI52_15785 [marine bacterium AO1-C]|nr:hypothetical protein BKI52_15785 [marine bacterium AO1-C]
MNLYITNAVVEDIETLNRISLASKKHWGYPQDWIDHWREDLKVTPTHFEEHKVIKAVLENDKNTIVGFCIVGETEQEYEVLHLWVDPPYIGKGHGKTLLNKALEMAMITPKDILVEADPNAEAFYKVMGFVTFDEVKSIYPEGRVLPLMRKTVDS